MCNYATAEYFIYKAALPTRCLLLTESTHYMTISRVVLQQ